MSDGFIFKTADRALLRHAENAVFETVKRHAEVFPITSEYDGLFHKFSVGFSDYKMVEFGEGHFAERFTSFEIDRVIFNDPATIVYWKDGTKTVVKCQASGPSGINHVFEMAFGVTITEAFDPVTGLALCFMKKACGNKGNYNDVFRRWVD